MEHPSPVDSRRVLLVHDEPADFVRVVQALATDLPEVLVVPVTNDGVFVNELQTGDFDLVLTREQLLEKVWGGEYFGEMRVVDVHLGHIRQKLGRDDLVATVRGVGYRFEDEPL